MTQKIEIAWKIFNQVCFSISSSLMFAFDLNTII